MGSVFSLSVPQRLRWAEEAEAVRAWAATAPVLSASPKVVALLEGRRPPLVSWMAQIYPSMMELMGESKENMTNAVILQYARSDVSASVTSLLSQTVDNHFTDAHSLTQHLTVLHITRYLLSIAAGRAGLSLPHRPSLFTTVSDEAAAAAVEWVDARIGSGSVAPSRDDLVAFVAIVEGEVGDSTRLLQAVTAAPFLSFARDYEGLSLADGLFLFALFVEVVAAQQLVLWTRYLSVSFIDAHEKLNQLVRRLASVTLLDALEHTTGRFTNELRAALVAPLSAFGEDVDVSDRRIELAECLEELATVQDASRWRLHVEVVAARTNATVVTQALKRRPDQSPGAAALTSYTRAVKLAASRVQRWARARGEKDWQADDDEGPGADLSFGHLPDLFVLLAHLETVETVLAAVLDAAGGEVAELAALS